MSDTATTSQSKELEAFRQGDLDPAIARAFAAQWREAQRLVLTAVIPTTITHTRQQVNGSWKDVPQPPEVIKATVFAVVRYGAEVFGYPGPVSLGKIDVIKGRLEPRYDALIGRMLDAGHQVRTLEMGADRAELKVRRREDIGDPDGWQKFSFTLEEAKAAGYVKEKPTDRERDSAWYTRRADMLMSKAAKRAFRMAGSDTLVQRELAEGASIEDMIAPARAAGIDAPAIAADPQPQVQGEATSAPADDPDDEVVDGELVEDRAPAAAEEPDPEPEGEVVPLPLSEPQSKKLHALLREKRGAVGPARHRVLEELLGHPVASVSDLTVGEASTAIDLLEAEPAPPPAEDR